MTEVNTIKTRILNKYDILANYTNTFIPLKGEICLVEIPSGTSNSGLTPPAVGIKVGDGSSTFDKLQWVQAIAGDVSSFVKTIGNNEDFAKKVCVAIGYTDKTNIKTVIQEINTKFGDYSTTEQMNAALDQVNTTLNQKVDTTTLTTYQNQVTQLLAGKVDNTTFTTYQGTVTAALDEKVDTSLLDDSNAPSENNKLLTETTINSKITAATGEIKEIIGDTDEFEGDTISLAIKGLQDAVGSDASGLATKVSTLEGILPASSFSSDNTVEKAIETTESHIGTLGSLTTTAKGSAVAAINELDSEIGTISSLSNQKANLVAAINDIYTTASGNTETLTELGGKVNTLIDKDTNKSVRQIATAVLTEELIPEGAEASLSTLEQIAQWIQDHPEDAAAMNTRLEELKAALGGTGSVETGYIITPVSSQIDTKISNLNLAGTYVGKTVFDEYKQEIKPSLDLADSAVQAVGTGSANGTISVDGADVAVKGLGSAAYTNTNDYVKSASFAGKAMTKTDAALSITQADARTALGLGTAAYKAETDFATASSVQEANESFGTFKQNFKNSSVADGKGLISTVTYSDSGSITTVRRAIKPTDLSDDTTDVFIFYCGNATGYDPTIDNTITIE